jgi:hypothetical protein
MDKYEQHKDICTALNIIYKSKNTAYGDAFGKTFDELGIISAVTRMYDKFNRIKALVTGEENKTDESIKDTLMDLANYCILTLIEIDKDKEPVSKEDNTLLDVQNMLGTKTKSEDCVCNFKVCPTCKQYSFFSHDGIVGYCINTECEYLNRYGG